MPPIREKIDLKQRYANGIQDSIELFVTHYIITEGENTEQKYLEALIRSEDIRIRNDIEIIPLEKTGEDKSISSPCRLLQFILDFKKKKKTSKEEGEPSDEYYIMFDRDCFKNDKILVDKYLEFLCEAKDKGVKLLINSPCIELWFLLHKNKSLETIIQPNENEVFNNLKISNNHTFTSSLCSKHLKFNSKNVSFSRCLQLIKKTPIAIEQAKNIEVDEYQMGSKIGTNLGLYINKLINDPRKVRL